MCEGKPFSSLPSMGRVARRAGWGDYKHPLRLASLGTSPIEGEEGGN
ncbi:hypothetical protein SAMN04488498_1506 [Mesorhizobium albiziae]|uniref:Uncharacterized protein n=1 Tax=Neomesorhizobium albiziae TaxID=335020 RepID=A0A1I4FPG4_9HYPH|nr:hypothetical protein SAMN04488498_1506 [Mesorhizobium albiziae]